MYYNVLTKVRLKYCVFKCFLKRFESVIQWSDGGRSFQARGPAKENARMPISVRQRGLMYWAVSEDCRLDLIWLTATARTMSEEYVGHWTVWIEFIMVHNLKSTRRSTVTSGAASELVSRVRSSVGRGTAALLRSERVEAVWSPTLADQLKLSCCSQASKERTSAPACLVQQLNVCGRKWVKSWGGGVMQLNGM